MSIERQAQKDDVPAELAELESRFFGRPRPGRAAEPLLWAYALGVLSLDEEETVQASVAGDDQALEALARIRVSLEAAQDTGPAAAPAAAAAPAKSLARQFGEATEAASRKLCAAFLLKPEEVAAVFLQTTEGLVVRALRALEVALEPASLSRALGGPNDAGQAAPGRQHRKKIRLPNGMTISVVAEPGGSFRLIVSLSDTSLQGLVEVRRLVARVGEQVEEETGIRDHVKAGVATLKECPAGALRIIAPDGETCVLLLGHEPPECLTQARTDAAI